MKLSRSTHEKMTQETEQQNLQIEKIIKYLFLLLQPLCFPFHLFSTVFWELFLENLTVLTVFNGFYLYFWGSKLKDPIYLNSTKLLTCYALPMKKRLYRKVFKGINFILQISKMKFFGIKKIITYLFLLLLQPFCFPFHLFSMTFVFVKDGFKSICHLPSLSIFIDHCWKI